MQVKRGLVGIDFGCVDFVSADDKYLTRPNLNDRRRFCNPSFARVDREAAVCFSPTDARNDGPCFVLMWRADHSGAVRHKVERWAVVLANRQFVKQLLARKGFTINGRCP